MSAHQTTSSCGRLVRGRRLLGPEGGNRGVVAQDSVLLPCYGDCKLAHRHVFCHALAQKADGLVRISHGSVSCDDGWGVVTTTSTQDRP
jgi:hypothetical protein